MRQAQETELALGQVQKFLRQKFANVEPWTDYFVCNTYYHADNAIGEHSDSHVLWGAVGGESVILSYTYEQAGIMVMYPSTDAKQCLDQTLVNHMWTKNELVKSTNKSAQLIARQVIEAVILKPNSMLAMGGFFQGQMLHETLPHTIITSILDMIMDNQALSFQDYEDQKLLTKLMNCKGWRLLFNSTARFRPTHSFSALF